MRAFKNRNCLEPGWTGSKFCLCLVWKCFCFSSLAPQRLMHQALVLGKSRKKCYIWALFSCQRQRPKSTEVGYEKLGDSLASIGGKDRPCPGNSQRLHNGVRKSLSVLSPLILVTSVDKPHIRSPLLGKGCDGQQLWSDIFTFFLLQLKGETLLWGENTPFEFHWLSLGSPAPGPPATREACEEQPRRHGKGLLPAHRSWTTSSKSALR